MKQAKKDAATSPHVIGQGTLSWHRYERVSNRYGAVYIGKRKEGLCDHDDSWGVVPVDLSVEGKKGTLVAFVLSTRQSGHIGDIALGITPTTPTVGERIILGTGTFFRVTDERSGSPFTEGAAHEQFGLQPDDEREDLWLDVKALYRCHDQEVRLEFLEGVTAEQAAALPPQDLCAYCGFMRPARADVRHDPCPHCKYDPFLDLTMMKTLDQSAVGGTCGCRVVGEGNLRAPLKIVPCGAHDLDKTAAAEPAKVARALADALAGPAGGRCSQATIGTSCIRMEDQYQRARHKGFGEYRFDKLCASCQAYWAAEMSAIVLEREEASRRKARAREEALASQPGMSTIQTKRMGAGLFRMDSRPNA